MIHVSRHPERHVACHVVPFCWRDATISTIESKRSAQRMPTDPNEEPIVIKAPETY